MKTVLNVLLGVLALVLFCLLIQTAALAQEVEIGVAVTARSFVCPTQKEAQDIINAKKADGDAAAIEVFRANDCVLGVLRFKVVQVYEAVDINGAATRVFRGEAEGNVFYGITDKPIKGVFGA